MKKTQIIIITLVVMLVLLCGIFVALYFATDIFKSEQELFYKYISQIDLKELIDLEEYSNYTKRLSSNPHSTSGEININIAEGENSNRETITYNGNSDPTNQKEELQIAINRDDNNLLTLNYLQNQDLIGIQFQDIINQYIVIENNNLKEFVGKLGAENLDAIPDKIDFNNVNSSINYEEIKPIINKYLNNIIEEIPQDNYSKIEMNSILVGNAKINADGYAVTIKLNDFRNILLNVLETAKNDQETYNLFNKTNNISIEDYQSTIDGMITDLSGEISSEENIDFIKISVYKKEKNTVKLAISILPENNKTIELSLDKINSGLTFSAYVIDNTANSQISIVATKTINTPEQKTINANIILKENNQETGNYNISLSRTGALTSSNIANNMSFTTSIEGTDVALELSNTTDFSQNQEIQDFTEGNYLVINNLPQEQLNNLFINLQPMVLEKLENEIIISTYRAFTNGLFETAQEASESTTQAIEEERNLSSGTVSVDGQEVPIEEFYT